MIIKPLIALSILLLAHSWYPAECCSNSDCNPVPCDSLIESERGIKYKDVEFTKLMIKPSMDKYCHVCISVYDTIKIPRCVYVTPTS